jgi:hypothetical protein
LFNFKKHKLDKDSCLFKTIKFYFILRIRFKYKKTNVILRNFPVNLNFSHHLRVVLFFIKMIFSRNFMLTNDIISTNVKFYLLFARVNFDLRNKQNKLYGHCKCISPCINTCTICRGSNLPCLTRDICRCLYVLKVI